MYKITGPCPDIIINPADVFPEKTHANELGPYEYKEDRKKRKNPANGPLRPINQPHHKEEQTKTHSHGRYAPADETQEAKRRSCHAGQQIILEVN